MSRTRSALSEASDVALATSLPEAPEEAIIELYRRHSGAVRARAMRVLGDQGLAEGVVQEVFLRFWQHPDSFDPERGTLRTYLSVQARSRAIEQRRSSDSRRQRESRSEADFERRSIGPNVEQEVVDHLVALRVRESVAALPKAERIAIEAAYFGERSYRDVATLLGRPEGTVKTRIRSGLGHLRTSLNTEVPIDLRDR